MLLNEYINNLISTKNISNDIQRDIKWLAVDILNKKTFFDVNNINLDTLALNKLKQGTTKLLKGIPLEYIINNSEFYGRKFYVNKNVLIPRKETEILCELIIKNTKIDYPNNHFEILDLCTGSGCIAITLASELHTNITASDFSEKALTVAKKNASTNHTNINFINSNMFQNINKKFDIIVSNPPYIETQEINNLDNSVKSHEPRLALDGGKDGLYFYNIIAKQAKNFLKKNGNLYLEIGYNQGQKIKDLLKTDFYDIQIIKDYNHLDRIISAKLKE